MNRANYEAEICRRLDRAERIPFREVSAEGWRPIIAGCHKNVDEWVRMNPRDTAARGWVTQADLGSGIRLVAHSVVRGADGKKFDITPSARETANKGLQEGKCFVEHLGDDEEFFALIRERDIMECPQVREDIDLCFDSEEQQETEEDPDQI
jgi:hypothetical protein